MTDGSMRWVASDHSTPRSPFSIYLTPRAFLPFSLSLGLVNRTLGGWGSLPVLHFYFIFFRLKSEPRTNIHFNNKMMGGGWVTLRKVN
jgi:hypothetical protein